MHQLLRRQLKRHFGSADEVPDEWKSFIDAVSDTYEQSDADRALIERSLELTSKELEERNRQLREHEKELEELVADRTARLERLNTHLITAAAVGRATTALLDPDELIRTTTSLITDQFGYYYAAIFLIDESGRWAVLSDATGEAGRILKERGHRLEVGGQSMVGTVTATRRPSIALDVGEEAVRFDNPLLPETRSEIALPLLLGDRVLGALDVQSTAEAAFDKSTIAVLQGMADQVATALENARLFEQSQRQVQEFSALNRIATSVTSVIDLDELLDTVAAEMAQVFDVIHVGITLLDEARTELTVVADRPLAADGTNAVGVTFPLATNPASVQVVETGRPLAIPDVQTNPLTESIHDLMRERGTHTLLLLPILARNEVVGTIGLDIGQRGREFTPTEITLAETIATQISSAVENARLIQASQAALAETQRLAERERQLNETVARIRQAVDMESILRTAAQEIQRVLGVQRAAIRVGNREQLLQEDSAQGGAQGGNGRSSQ